MAYKFNIPRKVSKNLKNKKTKITERKTEENGKQKKQTYQEIINSANHHYENQTMSVRWAEQTVRSVVDANVSQKQVEIDKLKQMYNKDTKKKQEATLVQKPVCRSLNIII